MNKSLLGLIRPIFITVLLTVMFGNIAGAATPWLHTSGNWIQDPNNNNVTLRGVSVVCPEFLVGARTTNQIIDTVANTSTGWYARVIRLAICTSGDPNTDYAVIDPIVQHCISAGLYVDIDLHFVSDYGSSSGQIPQSQVLAFWNSIAPHYANNSNVIFELYNEPVNPADWPTWKAYIQPVVNAVRTVAPNNLILMGSPQWSTYVNQAQASPLTGGNIVYVYHYYPNQGAPTTTLLDGKYGTAANSIPVVLGEFGWQNPGNSVTTGTTSGFGQPLQTYMEAHKNVSWICWVADNPDTNWLPIMFDSSWNILGGDNYQGQFIHDWLNTDQNDHQPGGATVPSAPTGLTASSGNAQAGLAWNASSGATSYNVLRSTVSGSGYASVATGVATTSYTNTGLTNGTTYYFVVSATNSAGTSGNSAQASAAPSATVKVNAGGPAVSPFAADAFFSGGTAATNNTGAVDTSAVTNPAPQQVYQSERWGNFSYTMSGFGSGAAATVRLHFTEDYNTGAGQRTFNVSINGTQVLTNFDIYATTGAQHKATIQQFSANANSSGQFVIQFTPVAANAKVDGIEILPTGGIPPTPTGLTATAGNAQVALSWNASGGATAYDVKRSTVSGSGYVTVSSPTTTSYTNTGLTNGTTYYFVVDAKNASGTSANSSQVSATPSAGGGGNTHTGTWAAKGVLTASATWSSLFQTAAVTANTAYTASFWMEGTGGVSLQIYDATRTNRLTTQTFNATSAWTQYSVSINTGSNTQLQFLITDSVGTAGTIYIDDCFMGVSGQTNVLANPGFESGNTGWTIEANPPFSIVQPGGGSPPAAPTGLAATPGNAQVALSWSASTGATSYNVKRSTVSGSGYVTVSSPTTTSYTNTGLTNGTTYYYVVTAVNASGESGNSSQVSAAPSAGGGNTHAGTWAVKGVMTSTATWASLYQIANCPRNTNYTASFWMKGTGGVDLQLWDGSSQFRFFQQVFNATSTWTQYSVSFNTSTYTQLNYQITDGVGTAGTLYIDDCFLGVANGTNILGNPGFESGNTIWSTGGPFTIVQNP